MIKQLVLSGVAATALVCALPVVAQDIRQGTIQVAVDSDLSFSSRTIKPVVGGLSADETTSNFAVGGLYYLVPNFGVGAQIQRYNNEFTAGTYKTKETAQSYGVLAKLNYSLGRNVSLQGDIEYSLGKAHREETDEPTSDIDLTEYAFGGGLAFFFNNYVSADAKFMYKNRDVKDNVEYSGFETSLGLSIYFDPI